MFAQEIVVVVWWQDNGGRKLLLSAGRWDATPVQSFQPLTETSKEWAGPENPSTMYSMPVEVHGKYLVRDVGYSDSNMLAAKYPKKIPVSVLIWSLGIWFEEPLNFPDNYGTSVNREAPDWPGKKAIPSPRRTNAHPLAVDYSEAIKIRSLKGSILSHQRQVHCFVIEAGEGYLRRIQEWEQLSPHILRLRGLFWWPPIGQRRLLLLSVNHCSQFNHNSQQLQERGREKRVLSLIANKIAFIFQLPPSIASSIVK